MSAPNRSKYDHVRRDIITCVWNISSNFVFIFSAQSEMNIKVTVNFQVNAISHRYVIGDELFEFLITVQLSILAQYIELL